MEHYTGVLLACVSMLVRNDSLFQMELTEVAEGIAFHRLSSHWSTFLDTHLQECQHVVFVLYSAQTADMVRHSMWRSPVVDSVPEDVTWSSKIKKSHAHWKAESHCRARAR